jgi:hypothetical protein
MIGRSTPGMVSLRRPCDSLSPGIGVGLSYLRADYEPLVSRL